MKPAPLGLLTTPRTPHLKAIWQDLIREKEVPQLDRWLVLRLKQDKRFGSKDRRFYADSIFSMMRYALELKELEGLDPKEAWQHIRTEDVSRLFEKIEALIEAGLKQGGLSSWYQSRLELRCQTSSWSEEQYQKFLDKQLERAPLWLRLNHESARGRAEKLLHDLEVPFEVFGKAYCIKVEKNLSASPLLTDGIMEVQDYGSQLLGESMELKANETLWDACAGGGGKSLQLGSLHPKAKIFASDVRAYKSSEVIKRAERAKIKNIATLAWDGSARLDKPKSVQNGFDKILVDAPCSGSGTFRRSPDGRFRINTASIQELQDLQFRIVRNVLPHLKKGGELIYATCSWLVEENEAVSDRIASELGLKLISQSLKGLPDQDSDTLFVARFQQQV